MTKILLFLAAASLAIAQVPQGKAPQSLAAVVRLKRAPVSNEVLKVKLPRPVERQLANGSRLLILESHRVPTVTFRMSLPSGSLRDPAGMPGVSDATAALIRLGTKSRTARDISDTITDLGAQLLIGATQGEAGISLSASTENFDAALAVLTDILMNPTFPPDEVERWKTRGIGSLEQVQTQPNFLATETFSKVLYGADARQFTHPTRDSLNRLTRDMIVEHYKTYYVPSGELAGISGDITPDEAVAKLNKALGAWKGGPVAHVSLPDPAPIKDKKVYLVEKRNSVQTLLVVANHAIDRNSPDYVECQVMNRILGGGFSSRLFRVREEKGYPNTMSSNFSATRYLNHFSASTSVQPAATEPALAEILKQFADIRDRAVSADELADAKSAIVASFALGLESSSGVLARWLEQREYGLPDDYWDTYAKKVMAVTAEDVQRVAKKYVPLDNAQIIVVGDVIMVPMLQKFGPVETIKAVD